MKPDSLQSRYQRGLGLLDLALCVDTSGKSSVECRSSVINYQIASTGFKVFKQEHFRKRQRLGCSSEEAGENGGEQKNHLCFIISEKVLIRNISKVTRQHLEDRVRALTDLLAPPLSSSNLDPASSNRRSGGDSNPSPNPQAPPQRPPPPAGAPPGYDAPPTYNEAQAAVGGQNREVRTFREGRGRKGRDRQGTFFARQPLNFFVKGIEYFLPQAGDIFIAVNDYVATGGEHLRCHRW